MLGTGEQPRADRRARGAGRSSRLLVFAALTTSFLVGVWLRDYETASAAVAPAREPRGNPLASLVRETADTEALVGRIERRLEAGSYTYYALRLERDGSRLWAVTLGGAAREGERARVRSFGRSEQFYSARLGRTFHDLVFGVVSPLSAAEERKP